LDYIRQINAFENWNEYNELGPGAQLLWYKLMRVANLSGWQNELSISNTRLQSMTKSSEKTLINNRNQLIQNGLLQYKKRGRTKAGIYILTDLTTGITPVNKLATGNIPVNTSVDCTVDTSVKPSVVSSVDTSAYINKTKLKETKQNNNIDIDKQKIRDAYSQKIIPMDRPEQVDRVESFVEEEFELDVVLFAIEYASSERKRSANYIVQLLNGWKRSGVKTVEDAKRAVENFKQSFKQPYNKKPIRTEPIPEWLNDPEGYNAQKEAEIMERLKKEAGDDPFGN
jgi:DnaD/phage-associated family protein